MNAVIEQPTASREEWLPIVERPGYEVSSHGRIRSPHSGRILTQQVTYRGYAQLKLGQGRWFLVHRLVAAAFIQNSGGKAQVNHIDGNPLNNAASNLEWVTQSENMLHAYATGLQAPPVWTPERIAKRSASQRGKTWTAEQRARMSAARKGKGTAPKSPEHRAKISAALRARKAVA